MNSSNQHPTNHAKSSGGNRITVTIPPKDYEVVRRMAQLKKVSAAWVVRDAVEKYIQADMPLFTSVEKMDVSS